MPNCQAVYSCISCNYWILGKRANQHRSGRITDIIVI
jgi:hypothetical protein